MRHLTSKQAAEYLEPFRDDFASKGKRVGLDADPAVLTEGRAGSGAVVFPGGRFDFAELADERGSTFVDGDLVVDGWVENCGGSVFVRGNLIARSIYTSGYLIVAGELRVERLLGADEPYGTRVFGDAFVKSAVFLHNHQFDVWGATEIEQEADDEREGAAAVSARLKEWSEAAIEDPATKDFSGEATEKIREKLREWALAQGKLPPEWADRKWTPKKPREEPAAPEPPPAPAPRSAIVDELEAWLRASKLTQREQIAALRSDWLPRLGETDRAEAKKVIRRAINSKKLTDLRDELLRALDQHA